MNATRQRISTGFALVVASLAQAQSLAPCFDYLFFDGPGVAAIPADMNGDGWLDVVGTEGRISFNAGLGWFLPPVDVSPMNGFATAVGDIDGNGWPDIVDNFGIAALNLDGSVFGSSVVFDDSASIELLALGDIDVDGMLDIIACPFYVLGGATRWYRNEGDGNFGGPIVLPGLNNDVRQLIVADFDSKNGVDIILYRAREVSVYMNDGAGNLSYSLHTSFMGGTTETGSPNDLDSVVMDYDHDGNLDFIASQRPNFAPNFRLWLFRGNGDGTFQAAQSLDEQFSSEHHALAAGDFNGDGVDDLMVFVGTDVQAWLSNNSGRTIVSVLDQSVCGGQKATAGDFSGDGIDDFALSNNDCLRAFTSLFPCLADLNSDCSVDFTDVTTFLSAFGGSEGLADIAEPFGQWDFSDVVAFLAAFGSGCS